MPSFAHLLEEITGIRDHVPTEHPLTAQVRSYNRRDFVLVRRALPLTCRYTFDELAWFLISRSPTAGLGQPDTRFKSLAELVLEGWARQPRG